MMELGEVSPSLEVDCHIQYRFLAHLSMTEPGEGSSPLEVDCYTRYRAPSPAVRCSVLRMDSLPPQAGREVRVHARALMAIASGVAGVAQGDLA